MVVILPGLTGTCHTIRQTFRLQNMTHDDTCTAVLGEFASCESTQALTYFHAGGSHDSYVQFTVKAVRGVGMRGIVYNPRGLADSPVLTPKLYSASYTGDFRRAATLH